MAIYLGQNELSTGGGGGGGGFTKTLKYSTARAVNDADVRIRPDIILRRTSGGALGSTSFTGNSGDANAAFYTAANAYAGNTFTWSGITHTITSSTANGGQYDTLTVNFTPALTGAGMTAYNQQIPTVNPNDFITVNPATDLGLEDGAQIGYFMVGGGSYGQASTSNQRGGDGGRIIQGTATITDATVSMSLTPGVGARYYKQNYSVIENRAATESTISGAQTLTSGDGSNLAGFKGVINYSSKNGINGYGGGGGPTASSATGVNGAAYHGYGWGSIGWNSNASNVDINGGDGAILLYY